MGTNLFDYFAVTYGEPNCILTRSGISAVATTGILQGDPLAPLMFCMAIQRSLIRLDNAVPDGHVYAYLYDITSTGPIDQVTRAFAVQKACFNGRSSTTTSL